MPTSTDAGAAAAKRHHARRRSQDMPLSIALSGHVRGSRTIMCSGAQSKCGGRAIKGTFRRTIGENIGDHERTLAETERTLGETDARSRKTDAHYLRPGAIALSS